MDTCKVEDCDRKPHGRGYCTGHYQRVLKLGHPNIEKPLKRPNGSGSFRTGYWSLYKPGHPNSQKHGYIYAHVYIMSEHLGRPLLPHENVHHINGDKLDNRIENLELWSKYQPPGQRVIDKVAWALEILQTYNPELLA